MKDTMTTEPAPIAKCPCGEHVRCIGAPGAWHLSHHANLRGWDCAFGGAPATITRIDDVPRSPRMERGPVRSTAARRT